MTIQELYDWAKKNNCEDCDILADHWSGKYLLDSPFIENNEVCLNAVLCYYKDDNDGFGDYCGDNSPEIWEALS